MRRACEPLRARWVNCMAGERRVALLVDACMQKKKNGFLFLWHERTKKERSLFFLLLSRPECPSCPIPFVPSVHTHTHNHSHMPSSCKEIRAELAECILKSNCMVVDGLSAKDCLHPDNEYRVPAECIAIRKSFFECRRGMVLNKANH